MTVQICKGKAHKRTEATDESSIFNPAIDINQLDFHAQHILKSYTNVLTTVPIPSITSLPLKEHFRPKIYARNSYFELSLEFHGHYISIIAGKTLCAM